MYMYHMFPKSECMQSFYVISRLPCRSEWKQLVDKIADSVMNIHVIEVSYMYMTIYILYVCWVVKRMTYSP